MKSEHILTAPLKDNPHKVEVRQMYSKPDAQVMQIILKPGESLKPHKTPVDVFFYVLEGTPTIHIGDEAQVFPADTLVESPKEIVHFISNKSISITRILVVKTPNPQGTTKVL